MPFAAGRRTVKPAGGSAKVVPRKAKRPLLTLFGNGAIEPARSRLMSRIRGRDTKPERVLRKRIWAIGARFVTHNKRLPGRPDISNSAARVAVFVDGCFWHGCPKHYREPKTRKRFWREKVKRNQERRRAVVAQYVSSWRVFQFYECELGTDLDGIATRVAAALLKNKQVGPRPGHAEP